MLFNLFRNKEKEIEKAKQKLISDLETKGVKYLLTQMNSEDVYSPLILERQQKQMSFSSHDYIRRYAQLQESKLKSPEDKKELLELLTDSSYSNQLQNIYCCLASICANSNDYDLFKFLLEKIESNDDEIIRASILSRLAPIKKPKELNIDVIKKMVVDGTEKERRGALTALSNSEDPLVEQLVLDEFQVSDRHSKASICVTLRTIATSQSIPILKEAHKQTRDRHLKNMIEDVLRIIKEKNTSSTE